MDVHEIVERWRESIPQRSQVEAGTGVGIVAIGVAAAVYTVVQKRRGFFAWAVPGALIAAGLVMLSDVVLDVRGERIDRTRAIIESELGDLDPIARAQVLRDIARDQFEEFIPGEA